MWSLQQKQKYLRQHLGQDQFEQFFQYIEQSVGNFNIEQWTNSYVMELVDQFKNKKQQQNKDLETSFYHYQAQQNIEVVGTMILNLADQIKQEQNKAPSNMKKKQPQVPKFTKNKTPQQPIIVTKASQPAVIVKKSEPAKTSEPIKQTNVLKQPQTTKIVVQPPKQQSAFDFLDSVFKKPNNNNKVESPNPMHFKTYSPVVEKTDKVQNPNPNQFSTNQFWDFGTNNTKGHKTSKPSVDFTQFDFWSQPSSSPQSSKINHSDAFSEKGISNFLKPQIKPSQKPVQSATTLSFDDLLLQCQPQKVPSPYKKKNAIQQVAVQGKSDQIIQVQSASSSIASKAVEKKPVKKKTTKVLYDGEVIIKKIFDESLKCFPSAERTKLKDPNLKVTIDGHQIIQRTFLMPDYAMYSVKIHPLEITCKRNYQDIQKLRNTLKKLFPGIKLPFLDSNSWFSGTNEEFIKNQKVMLEFFLNDLIRNPEIKNSKILEEFLTLPDHKKIKRKLEEWDKLEAPNCIQELCLMGGHVEVNLSEQQRLYHENFKRYHSKMTQYIEKQQKLTHTLRQQLKEIDSTEAALINSTKDMIQQTAYFNERVYDLEFQRINQALQALRNCYAQQNKGTRHRHELISSHIDPFMKYEKDNMAQLSELINIQQSFFKTYLKRSAYEKVQEGMPYTSDKIKNFKTGVLQESKNILVLKYQTGYLSNQLCQEGNRVVERFGDKIRDLLLTCAEKHRTHHSKASEFWSQEIYTNRDSRVQIM